jgi:hypothetical protein
MKIEPNQIYQHRHAPERIIRILKIKRGRLPFGLGSRKRVEVEYIGTTNPRNLGIVGTLLEDSVHKMYEPYITIEKEPDWRL